MTINNDILQFWPFPYPPRENQIKALEWLAEQDAKYLLLQAPVGAGKSNIGITYSHMLGNRSANAPGDSFILTPQRILQDQYERSFENNKQVEMASLYGKSNYSCISKNATCEIGSLVKPTCQDCPHKKAKKFAQLAADTVLNYKLALTSFAYTTVFKPRKLMILDECHTLENQLIDFDALQIAEWRCKKYNIPFQQQKDLIKALQWIRDVYLPNLGKAILKLEEDCEPLFEKSGTDLSKAEVTKIRELSKLQEHYDEATTMSLRAPDYANDNYVLVWDKVSFQFKRLTGAHSFHKIVVPFADRFLFMSSTILNLDGFCQDLGIPEKDAAYLSLDSEFPKENRPVFYMPQCKMNAKWKTDENKNGRKNILKAIENLLDIHKDESGLIHTGNFEIAQWLVQELEGAIPHKIYHHNPDVGDDRNAVIAAFQGDPKPSVLISPSSTEGLDLKDDLGRFAIFAKIGFPSLGDQWVKRRQELSNEWYLRKTLMDVIQGGGRVVRSVDDFGSVYILDQSWAYLYKQTYYMIPKWWREALQTV